MWGEFLRILICLLWTSFMMIVSYFVMTVWFNLVEKSGLWKVLVASVLSTMGLVAIYLPIARLILY
jgi:hypothetical protein